MKRLIMICLCLVFMMACQDQTFVDYPREDFESLQVYHHDFQNNVLVENLAFEGEVLNQFLDYVETLEGQVVDKNDLDLTVEDAYGVIINANREHKFLFIGDYVIDGKGEIVKIDGQEARRMCQSIQGHTRTFDSLLFIVNHRHLVLLDGQWQAAYLVASKWTGKAIENIEAINQSTSMNQKDQTIAFKIHNQNNVEVRFGSKLSLEVKVEGIWYNIDDIGHISNDWDLELFHLGPDQYYEQNYDLDNFLPLPLGKYRLVKEINIKKEMGYVSQEFEIK